MYAVCHVQLVSGMRRGDFISGFPQFLWPTSAEFANFLSLVLSPSPAIHKHTRARARSLCHSISASPLPLSLSLSLSLKSPFNLFSPDIAVYAVPVMHPVASWEFLRCPKRGPSSRGTTTTDVAARSWCGARSAKIFAAHGVQCIQETSRGSFVI